MMAVIDCTWSLHHCALKEGEIKFFSIEALVGMTVGKIRHARSHVNHLVLCVQKKSCAIIMETSIATRKFLRLLLKSVGRQALIPVSQILALQEMSHIGKTKFVMCQIQIAISPPLIVMHFHIHPTKESIVSATAIPMTTLVPSKSTSSRL